MASVSRHRDMKTRRSHAMLTGCEVSRPASAINRLLPVLPRAPNCIGAALAASHFILPELDHLDFRVKGFGVLSGSGYLCLFDDKL